MYLPVPPRNKAVTVSNLIVISFIAHSFIIVDLRTKLMLVMIIQSYKSKSNHGECQKYGFLKVVKSGW